MDVWLLLLLGDPDAAAPLLEECYSLCRRFGDEGQLACAVQIRGFAALLAGDFDSATDLLRDALTRHRQIGQADRAWITLFQLAMAAVFNDDPGASALCEQCVSICEREKLPWLRSYALWVSGLDEWRQGHPAAAKMMIREAIKFKAAHNDHLGIAQCLEALAWITCDAERHTLSQPLEIWRSY
ncbi:hypothetical protein [Actinoallomurus sp. NPDC050550]|uniref:hypothetical protein n=1 Tax=Actinoallomurus sp. NPDC050550 TaxID=3154937 RepID=UPI0033DA4C41